MIRFSGENRVGRVGSWMICNDTIFRGEQGGEGGELDDL